MKRNILLLTAVVLAAVMLTGCIGPFAKVKVDYVFKVGEGDALVDVTDNFDATKLVKKVKRNSTVEFELFFTEKATVTDDFYKVTVKEGKKDAVDATLSFIEKKVENVDTNVGIKFDFPVFKDNLVITVTEK